MSLTVPLRAVPSQTLNVVLASQNCQINIFQTAYGVFMDLYVNDESIILGVICQNLNRIVRSLYLGFIGDFVFIDNQGDTDPVFTGLGSRYTLAYLTQDELPPGQG